MNIRQRSVNVSRVELLAKLQENRILHAKEYAEALLECQTRLLQDLLTAQEKVAIVNNPEDLKDFKFRFQFPANHDQDYADVIEMLEMSVDETINLDSESFKAYIKNEWAWTSIFNNTKALYATAGAFLN